MKNSTIIIFLFWIALAIIDIVGLFTDIYLAFRIMFGFVNFTVILGGGLMIWDEFRTRRKIKKLKKEDNDELQLQ